MHYKIICRRGIAFILLLGFLSLSPIEARTVEWALPPTSPYYALQWVYPGLYEYNILDGKTRQFYRGFTDVEGNNVIQGSYGGFYYAFLGNGLMLILDIDENNDQEVKGLLSLKDRHFTPFPNGYYTRYRYFTDGLLCVQNKEGRVGYIDTQGREIVKCQFIEGEPFRDALAFVRDEKGQTMYISREWDATHKPLKIKAGRIEGYSFFNGHTLVRNKKNKLVKIGTDGKIVESSNSAYAEYDPTPYKEVNIRRWEVAENPILKSDRKKKQPGNIDRINTEDRLFGYSQDGKILVPMQFSEAEDFDGDYAVVTLNGSERHDGILHVIDGDYKRISIDSLLTIIPGTNSVSVLKGSFSYPSTVDNGNLRVMFLHPDNDELVDVTRCSFSNGTGLFEIQLDSIPNQHEFDLWYGVYYEPSLLVWENIQTVSIVESQKPSIISIRTMDGGASSDSHQLVWAHINNPTREIVHATLTVTSSHNGVFQVTKAIQPGENTTIELSVLVTKSEDAEVRVALNNGSSMHRLIRLQSHQSASQRPTTPRHIGPKQPPKLNEPKVKVLPHL